jgi:arginase
MDVNLIGVPLFYGSDREGVDLGPDKLRENNIVDVIESNHHKIYDLGNLYVPKVDAENKYTSNPSMKYLSPIVEVNENLAQQVYSSLTTNCFPFVVGGDHSLGMGSIAGSSKYYKNLAVIWVDAHGDINTDKTSDTGNVHGMPLAASMGIGSNDLTNIYYAGTKVKSENVFIIGARALDEGEETLTREKNLNVYSTKDVADKGIRQILDEIYKKIIDNGVDAIHLSFDIDCLDPSLVPGTGTPVSNGMKLSDAKYLIKYLMETKMIKSMDLVEFNTLLDNGNTTTKLVLDLVDWTFKYM